MPREHGLAWGRRCVSEPKQSVRTVVQIETVIDWTVGDVVENQETEECQREQQFHYVACTKR